MTLQEQYIRKHKRHHRIIAFARFCIIAVFLFAWEASTPDSKVKVMVIPTNEELAIARETAALVRK